MGKKEIFNKEQKRKIIDSILKEAKEVLKEYKTNRYLLAQYCTALDFCLCVLDDDDLLFDEDSGNIEMMKEALIFIEDKKLKKLITDTLKDGKNKRN